MTTYLVPAPGPTVQPSCVCNTTEPYPEWIAVTFRECVITERDSISFWIGFSSLGFWIFAQAPQFYKNCRLGSASGLSLLFLMQWMLGDSLNLCGSILTGQLGTVIYTSGLFVCMDVILFSQYLFLETECGHFFFPCCVKPKASSTQQGLLVGERGNRAVSDRNWNNKNAVQDLNARFLNDVVDGERVQQQEPSARRKPQTMYSVFLPLVLVFSCGTLAVFGSTINQHLGMRQNKESLFVRHDAPDNAIGGRRLLSGGGIPAEDALFAQPTIPICDASPSTSFAALGNILAWASAAIYLLSRIPQIVKNMKRGSVEGLSPIMFFCAVMGNATYATSMFVKGGDLVESLPFLVGSLGTLGFDFTILCQFVFYSGKNPLRKKHLDGTESERDTVPRGVHGIVDAFASPWSTPHEYQRARNADAADAAASSHHYATKSLGGTSNMMGRHGRSSLRSEAPGSA
jgi:uncharacterized protein with PQ loop repeat